MSISYMTNNGPVQVPTLSGGGVNLNILNRISVLESEVAALKRGKATDQEYGLAKISGSQDITETDSGLVLGAVQNNPSVEGTLANRILKTTDGLSIHFTRAVLNFTDGYAFMNLDKTPYGLLCLAQLAGGNWRDYAVCAAYPDKNRIFILLTKKITNAEAINAVWVTRD